MLESVLRTIDEEIERLREARRLLSGGGATVAKRGPGRPPKMALAVAPKKKKRNLSPEGRDRIRQSVMKRWAAKKKADKAAAKTA